MAGMVHEARLRPLMSTSYLARLWADEASANHIMAALAELLDTEHIAVALVAGEDGGWSVELHFAQAPDAAWLRDLVAQAGGEAASLSISPLAPRDWVKASLAGL